MSDDFDRHSRALDAELISDPEKRAATEALNGLRQFDTVIEIMESYLHQGRTFKLRTSHLLTLHRIALEGISAYAGNYRPSGIKIGGSKHQPVAAYLVPGYIEELCDYVNDNWSSASPVHLAAYVLWRLNWIHPFTDGNGRTARTASYLILCAKLGYILPGTNTIPEQIARDKAPYYKALEAADECCKNGEMNLIELEHLLSALLANQLVSVHSQATGKLEPLQAELLDRKFH